MIPIFTAERTLAVRQLPYSVTEITAYIKSKFDGDRSLQDLWLEGEISNWSRSRAGHCYLTLKDAGAAVRAVIWRTIADGLSFSPQDGQAVLAHGRVSVYEPQGQYQLYIDLLQPLGRGALYAQFEAVKARLGAEGLFDQTRKRPLPPFPRVIGLVTSPTGAAMRDIVNVLSRRWPLVQVVLSPTLVQGDSAPPQIVAALQSLYARPEVDLIILARGGGSIEDLWAFNDERVAREICLAPVPVISGVGHEVDLTIADLVADVRAPTPSAAAEVAVPDQAEIGGQLAATAAALEECVQRRMSGFRVETDTVCASLVRLSPQVRITRDRQRGDELQQRMERACRHRLALLRERLFGVVHRLSGLDPRGTMERGYAIVRRQDGTVVRSVVQVSPGTRIEVTVADGAFDAEVEPWKS